MLKEGNLDSNQMATSQYIITQNFQQLDIADFYSLLHCSTLVLLLHWRLLLVTAALFTLFTGLQDC